MEAGPAEYEPKDPDEEWYDQVEKCDHAWITRATEVTLHQATQEAIAKQHMGTQDQLVIACRLVQQYEARQISYTAQLDLPTNLEVIKKRMRRYSVILADQTADIRNLAAARVETLIGVRQILAKREPIDQQHKAAELLERGFYRRNLVLVHRL